MRSITMCTQSRFAASPYPKVPPPRHNEAAPVSLRALERGMIHTFLFEPGIWSGAGTFWTEDGKPTPAEGHTQITHRADCWLVAGSLKVLSSPTVNFVNNYFVEPPAREALT